MNNDYTIIASMMISNFELKSPDESYNHHSPDHFLLYTVYREHATIPALP